MPETVKIVEKQPNLTPEQIISIIAKLETNEGKTGVGRTRNNPTGIKCGKGYCSFVSYQEGLDYSVSLWRTYYLGEDIEDALAKWKTGNPKDRSEATKRYINNFNHLIKEKYV